MYTKPEKAQTITKAGLNNGEANCNNHHQKNGDDPAQKYGHDVRKIFGQAGHFEDVQNQEKVRWSHDCRTVETSQARTD